MKFVIYKDKRGLWRWKRVAGNNKTVADSGEGYSSKSNVRRAIKRFTDDIIFFEIVIEEDE